MRESFLLFLGLLSLVFFFFLTETAHTYPLPVTLNQHIGFADGPGTTNGGEFIVYPLNSTNELFRSFCLETNEYLNFSSRFIVGGISTAAINGGTGGGNPDAISDQTAYLYHNFYWKTLDQYAYDGATTEFADKDLSARDLSANALQKAIWHFEQESGYENVNNFYTRLANNAVTDGWSGLGDVRVINLLNASGGYAQDQLTVAPVPEPATMLLLGAGLIGLAGIGRKKLKTA
ncbi:MAG: PEP-CTERM sorting domain-containing protein [Syntrophaceae bacterium]|nr:PEP-CTERM sorting domain-containing protein [Syntrophaceae bacterium]